MSTENNTSPTDNNEKTVVTPENATNAAEVIDEDETASIVEATEDAISNAELTIATLTQQLQAAEHQAESYKDNLLRVRAETENARKRMERDLDNARKFALEKIATELLSVNDSLELGVEAAANANANLESVREGINLTLKQLQSILEKFGVLEINPANQKFDPQFHEAMAMQAVPNVENGTVLFVAQKGYQLNERLLRPARVIVAKALES
ncbi:MAG: nucleotide exchange factor GrpE [Thiotrichaceae bacterium]|nr:nucleotide exchange factor GrpE [Thiotrichaceae bacterium]